MQRQFVSLGVKSGAARSRDYRASHPVLRSADKPFAGCDGEGWGVDSLGRQHYMQFRIGDEELFTGRPLSTVECLEHICLAKKGLLLVGFSFGYDTTMILRDLPPEKISLLFDGDSFAKYVFYADYAINYLPRNYLRVGRVATGADGKRRIVKGSFRTIYEVFGLFQKSFLKVLEQFKVGGEYLEQVASNKKNRENFTDADADEIRDYNRVECLLLADLMEKFRGYCRDADILPRTWSGAGKLARALHNRFNTIRSDAVLSLVPAPVLAYANAAYYGGRFEISRTGYIPGPVYESDIGSAYPDAMRSLPCLEHGTWREVTPKELRGLHSDADRLYVASVEFREREAFGSSMGKLAGLPIRTKAGHLQFPLRGGGIYWSIEIRSAERLGFHIGFRKGWVYEKRCACCQFGWVDDLYEYRKSIGKNAAGYPIKLGINALYGLLAQRKGAGRHANYIYSGIITAITRSRLNDAIALNQGRIVMVATDAVYSLDPLPLDYGERLGQWEETILPDLFIVQPGLYWSPAQREVKLELEKRKKKSRGLSGKFFEQDDLTQNFETQFSIWLADPNKPPPVIPVKVNQFIGVKLAYSRNNLQSAGKWIIEDRDISFAWTNKRSVFLPGDGHIITAPWHGSGGAAGESLAYRDWIKSAASDDLALIKLAADEQPDYIDLDPPWSDD